MFEMYRSVHITAHESDHTIPEALYHTQARVFKVYERVLLRGWLRALWATVVRRSTELRPLPAQYSITPVVHMGQVRPISIAQIVGSEDRADDFDNAFLPLQDHTRNRWISIATAWVLGQALPPVELIQLGDEYYVRDGHHRISVARAFGQHTIDAVVLVWRLGPQPEQATELCAVV